MRPLAGSTRTGRSTSWNQPVANRRWPPEWPPPLPTARLCKRVVRRPRARLVEPGLRRLQELFQAVRNRLLHGVFLTFRAKLAGNPPGAVPASRRLCRIAAGDENDGVEIRAGSVLRSQARLVWCLRRAGGRTASEQAGDPRRPARIGDSLRAAGQTHEEEGHGFQL